MDEVSQKPSSLLKNSLLSLYKIYELNGAKDFPEAGNTGNKQNKIYNGKICYRLNYSRKWTDYNTNVY